MCGIIGLTLFKKDKETKKQRQKRSRIMRSIVFDCIENSTSRGRDATGIAFITNKEWVCMKQPVDAADFFIEKHQEEGTNLREFVKKWDETTSTIKHVLAHVRASTQGSKYDPENNHPLIMKEEDRTLLGIHNGTISNDEELTKKHSLTREAKVDSEVIFRLADKLSADQAKGYSDESFVDLLKMLKGNFAVMTVSNRNKDIAWFAVHGRPLNIFYIPETHSAIYISESRFLDNALKNHNKLVYRGDAELLLTSEESFKSVTDKFFYVDCNQEVESVKDIVKNIQPMKEEDKVVTSCYGKSYKGNYNFQLSKPINKKDKKTKSKDNDITKEEFAEQYTKEDKLTTTTCDDMPTQDVKKNKEVDVDSFEHDFEEELDEFYDLIDEGRDYLGVLETGKPLGDASGGELFYDTKEYQQLMLTLGIGKSEDQPITSIEEKTDLAMQNKDIINNLTVVLETCFAQGYAYGYINSEHYLFEEKDKETTDTSSKEEILTYKKTLIRNQTSLINKLTRKVVLLSETLRDVLRKDLSYKNARQKAIGEVSQKELKQALKTVKEYTTK